MNRLSVRGLVVLLVMVISIALSAATEEKLEITWSELEAAVSGRKVALVLPDGTYLEGRVLAVESFSLSMQIAETSHPKKHPKGLQEIQRSQVSTLRLRDIQGSWRMLATAIGAGVGAAGAWAGSKRLRNEGNDQAAAALSAGLIGGAAGGGYLLGREADRHNLILIIKPE